MGKAVTGIPTLRAVVGGPAVDQLVKWLNLQDSPPERDQSDREFLMDIARGMEPFQTPDGVLCASYTDGDRFETSPIRSHATDLTSVEKHLRRTFYRARKKVANAGAIDAVLADLEARADLGPVERVHYRVAQFNGNVYIDLADRQRHVVEITPGGGWQVLSKPPVRFLRHSNMAALPLPVRGGSLDQLRPFVNLSRHPDASDSENADVDADWMLVAGWLVGGIRDATSHAILILQGEPGVAKSWATRFLVRLIDPVVKSESRALPKTDRDLAIAAKRYHMLAFSNVSYIPPEMSDTLARVSTGEGYALRRLYTDDDEVVFGGACQICINGVGNFATRVDLLDRSIVVHLRQFRPGARRLEAELEQEFEAVRPQILGALYDAISTGLANLPNVKLADAPRMADFARFVVACEPALPWEAGGFLRAYDARRRESAEMAVEASLVARTMYAWAKEHATPNPWIGTMSELLIELEATIDDEARRSKHWPKSATVLSSRLRNTAPALRKVGVMIEFDLPRSTKEAPRLVRIRHGAPESPNDETPGGGDGTGDDEDGDVADGGGGANAKGLADKPSDAFSRTPSESVSDEKPRCGRALQPSEAGSDASDAASNVEAADGKRSAGVSHRDALGEPAVENSEAATSSAGLSRSAEAKPDEQSAQIHPISSDGAYRYVTQHAEAVEALVHYCGGRHHHDVLGVDLETTGLDPLTERPRLLQLKRNGESALLIDLFKVDFRALRDVIDNLPCVAHNAVFEMQFMRHHGGIHLTPHCTMIADHVLTGKRRSLAELAHDYLGITLEKEYQRSDWSAGTLSTEQLRYAATDAEVVHRLHMILSEKLQQAGSTRVYDLAIGAQSAVVSMMLAGMPFNHAAHRELINQLNESATYLERAVADAFPGIDVDSSVQLAAWLEGQLHSDGMRRWDRTDGGRLSTSEKALTSGGSLLVPEARRAVEEVLLPYRTIAKRRDSFGDNLRRHMHAVTGRIHSNLHLAGTTTGRMAASDPNLQQIPHDPEFRRLFVAPEGRVFIIADYSQMELRILAHVAGDLVLRRQYANGEDVHRLTAAMLLRKTADDVTKDERQLAKAVNFGLAFGQYARGLRNYAKRTYGIDLSIEQADAYRRRWLETHWGVERWQREIARQFERRKEARTPCGRLRPLEHKGVTAAYNTPVQGGAAEVLLAALGRLTNLLDEAAIDATPILAVHDEILVEASEAAANSAKAILEKAMCNGMLDVFPDASTLGLVEAHLCRSWADK